MKRLLALLLIVVAASAEPPAPGPFVARRERLQKTIGGGMAIVPSAPAADRFRQDNDFWYLTGLDWPDAALVLTKDGAWLFAGEGVRKAPEGFDGVEPMDQLDVAAENGGLLWIPGGRSEYYSAFNEPGVRHDFGDPFERSTSREKWGKELLARIGGPKARGLESRLARMRQIKDAAELDVLRRAADATGKALMEAMAKARPGMGEAEFQKILEQGYKDRGAAWLAFPSIVGSGKNGTTIHYTENAERLDRNELVVVDTGAEIGMYACDVTRTFPADGHFSKRQREVYEAVLAAQEAAIRAIKPGVTLLQLHAVAQKELDARGFGKMPHLTSHWVGLQVHDVGAYAAKLEPGMVLTVEPGVYLPDESIGVRIEDVLVVTETGSESLTGWIPRAPGDVEKLAGSSSR